ncbi:MAG: TonB-dependent receptor, partial [Bacteroidetes bacterium]|nr:TonB-dependent receptor [Bacteroidota bacterium]
MRTTIVAGLIAALCCSAVLYGGTTGKIAGKITDAQTGESLVGVNVLVVGMTLGASSDIDGEYFILNVPPGTYNVRASAVGYSAMTINAVKVMVDQTARIPFSLQPQTVEMNDVLITAERPIVQKDLTSTTASVSGEEIATLPLEDIASVVNLQAGVVDGHFRGGRSNEVKYLIDGVSVNDVFSGGFTLQAEVNSVAEVQVLSGTFNAEYGEAMSGVVNQVTKIAGEAYTGEVSAYAGGYMTNRTGLFIGRDAKKFLGFLPEVYSSVYNVQGSLSGPIPEVPDLLRFFVSGRYLNDNGSIFGTRKFNPSDSSEFSANNPEDWYIGSTGDTAEVSMNYSRRLTFQGKLEIKVGSAKGIVLQGLYQQSKYREYDHSFRLNPDGDYQRIQKSTLFSGSYTHVFGESSFLDVTGSAFLSDYKQYVFENPLDPQYVNPERQQDAGANSFLTGGTQNWHFKHTTTTMTGRMDYTAQITPVHQVKAGVEAQAHTLKYEDFQIRIDAGTGYHPQLPPAGSFDFNQYKNNPFQLAGYVQDKIELDYLVVNVGVRFDYFEPDGMALINPDSIAALDNMQP